MNALDLSSLAPSRELDASETYFRENIARHSRSFALASRILPASCRADVAVVYAWCRRADDAIDLAEPEAQPLAVAQLRRELDSVYAREPQSDATLRAFQAVVLKYAIPSLYPLELLNGMEMDATGASYRTLDQLLVYCYRVAGTVGLMLCHVFSTLR